MWRRVLGSILLFCVSFAGAGVAMAATDSVYVEHDWLVKNLGDKAVVVIDMTADDVQYMRYHIPGAVRISYQVIVMKRNAKF